jgi:hypothetical protein
MLIAVSQQLLLPDGAAEHVFWQSASMPQWGTQELLPLDVVLLPLDVVLLPPPDVVLLPLDDGLLPLDDGLLPLDDALLPPPDVGLPDVVPAPLPPDPELVWFPLAQAARRAGRERARVMKIVAGCFTVVK